MKLAKPKLWLAIGAGITILALVISWLNPSSASDAAVATFVVQKGPLQINVLQGGEIRALHNVEVKSEIETPTKILSLIPEGYLITEDDIKEGKVLVELDNSDIKTRIQDHEIQFQSTVALYIDADEGREIQRSENQSLIRDLKENSTFALMDFEKYLGRDLAAEVLESAGLPRNMDEFDKWADALESQADSNSSVTEGKIIAASKAPAPEGAEPKAANDDKPLPDGKIPESEKNRAAEDSKPAVMADLPIATRIDFTPYLEKNAMSDGAAQQKLRQLADDLLLSKSLSGVAKQKMEASERLAAREFIAKAQLENDQVSFEKAALAVKTAETDLALYKTYEFSKECARLLSAYRESLTKLERNVRANRSKMAQAETRFQTTKRRYEMELEKREELDRQLNACLIHATTLGLVAYGDLNANARYSNETVQEGANVRFRQTILTIPDMSQMGVHVNIHESQVKKIKIGQPVLIRVDAEPGKILEGRVAELALLPDSSSSRFTPNLKVYPSSVHILGMHDWLKPGMNAKVEIIVNQLADVLYVPVQSIEVEDDHHFCYVNSGAKLERREIVTGLFNDEFIEIRNGLQTGELVALSMPKKGTSDTARQNGGAADDSTPGELKPKGKGKKDKNIALVAP